MLRPAHACARQAKQLMGATGSLLGDGAGRMPFEILAAQPPAKSCTRLPSVQTDHPWWAGRNPTEYLSVGLLVVSDSCRRPKLSCRRPELSAWSPDQPDARSCPWLWLSSCWHCCAN